MKKNKIVLILGPNLNMLGQREPALYGKLNMIELVKLAKQMASASGFHLVHYQSNHEGRLIDKIQNLKKVSGVVMNLGAYTHTSIALRDAVLSVDLPFVEFHMSDPKKREKFRRVNYFEDIVLASFVGKKEHSMVEAIHHLIKAIK